MADDLGEQVTTALAGLDGSGDPDQRLPESLLPLVYDDLRRLAGRYLRGERRSHTLQATEVVHEAYLRLVDQTRVSWQGRTHFLAIGAQMMRRILVDHARARSRDKRGGDWQRITLCGLAELSGDSDLDPAELLDLDAALTRLAALDSRQASIVELRFFAGLSNDEIAAQLGVSKRTVVGHWAHARAWLRRELARMGA